MVMVANCIPVKGYSRSIIYDLYRETFDFIPNDLFDLISKYNKQELAQVFGDTPSEFHHVLDEYIHFLLEKEYILLTDRPNELACFPDLNLEWDMPATITNAIIDIGSARFDIADYTGILRDLNDLGCTHLQFRFFPGYDHRMALELLGALNDLDMLVEVLIPYDPSQPPGYYVNLYRQFQKIQSITVFDFHGNLDFFDSEDYRPFAQYVRFTAEVISDQSHCGIISPAYFSVNIPMFTESLQFNSCLNRKVAVDQFGNIRNCPSLTKSYGLINDSDLKQVVHSEAFRECWTLNKDKISICRVCEFRYMCTDCRAFVPNATDKPLRCSYNPITCEWN
ncbi:grasp-with-spasm system SPASM domain peptide maturase [Mucilaginibacter oryzae]|nr:grasp-with-spasm system SPASM domain peptide maturase [Mucilaginibacter oryzae]